MIVLLNQWLHCAGFCSFQRAGSHRAPNGASLSLLSSISALETQTFHSAAMDEQIPWAVCATFSVLSE